LPLEEFMQGSTPTATILVVDDEVAVRSYMTRVLEAEGYAVLEAGNVPDALTVLDGEAGRVRLVITDVVMPGLTGRDLAARLSERPSSPPILFVSGSEGDVPGPLLRKPFLPTDLSAVARNLIHQ
jgi:CheY-like chemotaxis protein